MSENGLCPAVAVNHRQEPVLFCWLQLGHRGDHMDREHQVRWRPMEPGDPAGVPALMKPPPPGGGEQPGLKKLRRFHRVSRFDPDEQMARVRGERVSV